MNFQTIALFTVTGLLATTSVHAAEVVIEKDNALPLTHISIAIPGGGVSDPDGKNGLTNILFKMLVRGTKSKTKSQLDLALDDIGATVSSDTRAEFSTLEGTVLSSNLKAFLELLTEVLTQPSFKPSELDRLRGEKTAEMMNQLSSDAQISSIRFAQSYFAGHLYSKTPAGRLSDLPKITIQDLETQYKKIFKSKNWIILALGDVKDAEITDFVGGLESKLPGEFAKTKIQNPKHPTKVRALFFDKPDRTQTVVRIGTRGLKITDKNLDLLDIANEAFGGAGFQTRLLQALRVKTGWTYSANSGYSMASAERYWNMIYQPKNGDLKASLKKASELLADFRNGLTQVEFDFAKQKMINSAAFDSNTAEKRVGNRLVEIFYGLPKGHMSEKSDRIKDITLEQVNAFLKDFIQPDKFTYSVVGTAAKVKGDFAAGIGIPESAVEVFDYKKEL